MYRRGIPNSHFDTLVTVQYMSIEDDSFFSSQKEVTERNEAQENEESQGNESENASEAESESEKSKKNKVLISRFSPNGNYLAIGCANSSVAVFEIIRSNENSKFLFNLQYDIMDRKMNANNLRDVVEIAWSIVGSIQIEFSAVHGFLSRQAFAHMGNGEQASC